MGALSAEVGASDDGDGDDDESGLGNEDDERKDDDEPRLRKVLQVDWSSTVELDLFLAFMFR